MLMQEFTTPARASGFSMLTAGYKEYCSQQDGGSDTLNSEHMNHLSTRWREYFTLEKGHNSIRPLYKGQLSCAPNGLCIFFQPLNKQQPLYNRINAHSKSVQYSEIQLYDYEKTVLKLVKSTMFMITINL